MALVTIAKSNDHLPFVQLKILQSVAWTVNSRSKLDHPIESEETEDPV
jgi:hypothetical protein